MATAPFPASFLNGRVRGTLVKEDPEDEIITASSRSQKGEKCKLDCSTNPNAPGSNGQCGLGPGQVLL